MAFKRIGVFAGTFDPVHEGHLSFADNTVKTHKLDEVVFLIEPRPRHKTKVSSLKHRKAMLQVAIKNYPKFKILGGVEDQFTLAKTIPWLQSKYPGGQLYMLMGSDVAMHLKTWPDIGLLHKIPIILTDRKDPGWTNISSSHIRAAISLGVEPPPTDLSPEVLDYIKQYKLYSVLSPSSS